MSGISTKIQHSWTSKPSTQTQKPTGFNRHKLQKLSKPPSHTPLTLSSKAKWWFLNGLRHRHFASTNTHAPPTHSLPTRSPIFNPGKIKRGTRNWKQKNDKILPTMHHKPTSRKPKGYKWYKGYRLGSNHRRNISTKITKWKNYEKSIN